LRKLTHAVLCYYTVANRPSVRPSVGDSWVIATKRLKRRCIIKPFSIRSTPVILLTRLPALVSDWSTMSVSFVTNGDVTGEMTPNPHSSMCRMADLTAAGMATRMSARPTTLTGFGEISSSFSAAFRGRGKDGGDAGPRRPVSLFLAVGLSTAVARLLARSLR